MIFPADEGMAFIIDVDAFIPIFDDEVDEAEKQFFIAYLELVDSINPDLIMLPRVICRCIILDNDRELVLILSWVGGGEGRGG